MSKQSEDVSIELRAIAAELREHPERWTQGWFAKTADGKSCYSDRPGAICWCAAGFIRKRHPALQQRLHDCLRRALNLGSLQTVGDWNDVPGRTAAQVADAFYTAAMLAERAK